MNADKVAKKWVDSRATNDAAKSPEADTARRWLDINVQLDTKALEAALKQIYGSGWAFGTTDSDFQMFGEIADPWDGWIAGNESAAALVDPPKGLKKLLAKSGTTIDGLKETTLNQLGTQLAESLSRGLGADETARMLSSVIDDPLRAMVIARTETARAICDSNVANYREHGVSQMQWISADPCILCAENEGVIVEVGEPFPTGDEYPPAHPNCVCDVSPVGSVDKTINKYSDDQPRDSNGRFGSGSGSSESKPTGGKTVTPENALEQLWTPAFLQHDGGGFIATALETATNASDIIEAQMAIKEQADEIKGGTVKALAQSEIMQNVPTDKLLAASDVVLDTRRGYGSVEAGQYKDTMHQALVPPTGPETEDGDDFISLVEQSGGEIGLVHWADVVDYSIMEKYGVTNGLATPEQVEQMTAEQNRINIRNGAGYSYAVTGSESAVDMVREASTSLLVQQWATSSNDSNPISLSMQQAAADQLKIENYAGWKAGLDGDVEQKVQDTYEQHGEVYRAFVQAQYDTTQAFLAEQGITAITAYRGEVGAGNGTPDTALLRPLSSWSTSHDVALGFTSTVEASKIYTATIPASQIVAIAGTGVGCAHEFEIVTSAGQLSLDNVESTNSKKSSNAENKIVNLDKDDLHADWIKTLSWDLPTKVRPFLIAIGFDWEHFKTLPACKAMPEHLAHDVDAYVKANKTINKYNPDQERDERGRFGAGTGSDTRGMAHRDRAKLQKSSDSQKDKLYKAESTLSHIDTSEKPVSPDREDFETYNDYADAYDEYAEKWNAWALEQNTNLISDTAEQHLDGTSKGVQNYVQEIIASDWFTQQFGNVLQNVQTKVASFKSFSGQYAYGIDAKGNLVNRISIDKVSAKDELTIIHEIAHFATTQSVDAPYEGHGSEYAQNHLFITEQILGTEAAAKLEQAYIDGGVSYGK